MKASNAAPSRAAPEREGDASHDDSTGLDPRMRVKPHAHAFDRAFYAKLAGVSFVIGAAFEAFMLKTDFYAKVVHIEAERRFLAEQRREGEGSRDVGSRSAS